MNHEILVVVADELTRRAFQRSLTDHGHTPVFAGGPDEAIAVASARNLRLCVIDLQGSPVLAATELAEELLATVPAARAIIIHDPDDSWHADGEEPGQIQFLQRPFSMFEFISSVDHALSVEL